jgi:hypothetical protein
MLKNGKYVSKDKSVVFFFTKIHHFGGPKHCPIPALPGLDRKKKSSSTYSLTVMQNLKFQLKKTTKKKQL